MSEDAPQKPCHYCQGAITPGVRLCPHCDAMQPDPVTEAAAMEGVTLPQLMWFLAVVGVLLVMVGAARSATTLAAGWVLIGIGVEWLVIQSAVKHAIRATRESTDDA